MRRAHSVPGSGPGRDGTILAMLVVVLILIGGCDSSTDPGTSVPEGEIRITSVGPMEPGRLALILGHNLDRIEHLVVDGEATGLHVSASAMGIFRVPETRACEVDARRVRVVANDTLTAFGRIQVAGSFDLDVGETVELSSESLTCLQFARGPEDYGLSVLDLGLEPGPVQSVLEAQFFGTGEIGTSSFLRPRVSKEPIILPTAVHPLPRAPEGRQVADPGPFDAYGSAQVGDTVQMVDWTNLYDVLYQDRKEDVPQFPAAVVAATEHKLIVADLRSHEGRTLAEGENAEALQQAASMVSEVAGPGLELMFGPSFAPPDGADGRMITLLEDRTGLATSAIQLNEIRTIQPWVSGMFLARLDADFALSAPAREIARTVNHEFGRLGDHWWSLRLRGDFAAGSLGWYQEAFATSVEDVMARLARGDLQGAEDPNSPDYPSSRIRAAPMVSPEELSAWGDEEGERTLGWYDLGGRILRYAQERLPMTEPWILHQTLAMRADEVAHDVEQRRQAWGIESIADVVGMEPKVLIEEAFLAEITHGLIPESIVAARGLPRIRGWAPHFQDPRSHLDNHARSVDRRGDGNWEVELPPASFSYRYVPSDLNRGVSLTGTFMDPDGQRKFLLTRLR